MQEAISRSIFPSGAWKLHASKTKNRLQSLPQSLHGDQATLKRQISLRCFEIIIKIEKLK
jgi:hypothetical protein